MGRAMANRSALNFSMFLILAFCWASAFTMTKVAVGGLPAGLIVFARLAIGAAIMGAVMLARGERFPPLQDRRAWATMAAMGFLGTTAPFMLITIGQKDIDSALAALLISATPLFVAGLAHFVFRDEKMSWNKALGIAVGFAGVAILLGPDAVEGIGDSTVIAQLLCLGAGLCYATNTIIARAAPPISPSVLPAGFLAIAALTSAPFALFADYSAMAPDWANIASVIGLGALPTAAAGWLLMVLIVRTSATFVSMTGYVIPVFAGLLGAVFLGEQLAWDMAVALALILIGVWLARRAPKPLQAAQIPRGSQ